MQQQKSSNTGIPNQSLLIKEEPQQKCRKEAGERKAPKSPK